MRWRLRLWVAASLTLLAMTGTALKAQELEKWFEKDLPEITFMPEEEFEAQTILYEEVPFGDEALAYQVRLPQNWIAREVINDENAVLTGLAPQEIALYTAPLRPDEQSFFRISAIDLPVPVTAQDWFLQYVLTNGLALEGIRVHSTNKVEALFVQPGQDVEYAIRSIAKVIGDRIVLAQFYVPTGYWQQEHVLQAQIMDGFRMTNQDAISFDARERFEFPNIVSVAYPKSWKVQKSRLYSDERLYLQLLKDSGRQFLDGLIDIDVVPREMVTDIGAEMAALRLRAGEMRFSIGELIETKRGYEYPDWIIFGASERYAAKHTQQKYLIDHEFWISVLVSKDHYFFIMMLTPGREDEFTNWSENASTYQSIIEGLGYIEPNGAEVAERKKMMQNFRELGLESGID